MELNEFQEQSFDTAVYPHMGTGNIMAVIYCALGLGEAGEVQGKVKKIMRDDSYVITDEKREALLDECGDVLWYIAMLSKELDSTLEMVARKNMQKLADRKARGVLSGSGDNR